MIMSFDPTDYSVVVKHRAPPPFQSGAIDRSAGCSSLRLGHIVSATVLRSVLCAVFVSEKNRRVIMHCTMSAAGFFGLRWRLIRW
jgi:hypothetical protein